MAFWPTFLAALQAIPTIANAISELIGLFTKIEKQLSEQRAIQEFEAARKLSRETGNTSELERMLGRPVLTK